MKTCQGGHDRLDNTVEEPPAWANSQTQLLKQSDGSFQTFLSTHENPHIAGDGRQYHQCSEQKHMLLLSFERAPTRKGKGPNGLLVSDPL